MVRTRKAGRECEFSVYVLVPDGRMDSYIRPRNMELRDANGARTCDEYGKDGSVHSREGTWAGIKLL